MSHPVTNKKPMPALVAFGLAISAYIMFTMGDAMGKWLQGTYHASQILLTINIFALGIMAVTAARTRGIEKALYSEKWKLHFLRGTIITVSTVFVLYALKKLPLADFYGIVFLNPLWVAIISRVFLKETIPPSRWAAIIVGFIGVVVIAGSQFTTLNLGFFAALTASVLGAISALLARHIGGNESPTTFGIATHIPMIIANLMLLPGHYVAPTLPHLGLMGIYGALLAMALMFISSVFARSNAVSQVAPLQYSQMLWGILIGWLVFNNAPTPNVLAGAMLVIGAGIYILRSLHRGRLMTR